MKGIVPHMEDHIGPLEVKFLEDEWNKSGPGMFILGNKSFPKNSYKSIEALFSHFHHCLHVTKSHWCDHSHPWMHKS